MPEKATLPLICSCEKEHPFEETFLVEGAGKTTVQVRCPHALCPAKNPLLSFPIPYELARDNVAIKGRNDQPKP